MSFTEDLKKIMILYPDVETKSTEDHRNLINLHNLAERAFGNKLNIDLVKSAFKNRDLIKLKTANDYFYLLFKSALLQQPIKKNAYPHAFEERNVEPQVNLEKWVNLVYKIYAAVDEGDMSLLEAVDYYADSLDHKNGEDENFKQWLKYYQTGEHLKYSEEDGIRKKSNFQFPLNGPGFYGPENAIIPPKDRNVIKNVKKEMDGVSSYKDWRDKLYSAIRRIDKLLRQSDDLIDPETQRDLADLLHQFDQELRTLKYQATASDLAFRYANQFRKKGFDSGYNEFMKYAQEAPNELTPELPDEEVQSPAEQAVETPELPAPELPTENSPSNPVSLKSPEETVGGTFNSDSSSSSSGGVIKDNTEVSLADAISKLEEVAGKLSDRNTIRLLAEFDIILDRLGIAAMFPELAEAQSKLIDGYSYALTRTTKMLGMLSSGKNLATISDAKKQELAGKTMKEVNKTFEEANTAGATGEAGVAPEAAIQKGLEETPVPAPTPASPAALPATNQS